jgi:hypothetical protein
MIGCDTRFILFQSKTRTINEEYRELRLLLGGKYNGVFLFCIFSLLGLAV